jgi:N-acetylglucosaminyldiphosphoundecaprenol N-acetyl-beta-D-mannosaminyltransferase
MNRHLGNQSFNHFLEFEILNKPIEQAATELGSGKIISFCSADVFVVASKNSKFKEIIQSSVIFCDSKPLEIYLRIKNGSQHQIRGSDYMRKILTSSEFKSHEHLFLGGTEEVKTGLTDFILKFSPQQVASHLHFIIPPQNVNWELAYKDWLEIIQSGKFKHVWIGLGNPKQFFIANLLSQNISSAQYYCVGAAFDFLSGVKRETPRIFQKLALEWLFRLIQEPGRLWRRYLVGNFSFLKLIITDSRKWKYDK